MKKCSHSRLMLKHKKSDYTSTDNIDVKAIINALNQPKYKARTVAGIAADINSSVNNVKFALNNDSELINTVKIYPRQSSTGEILVTTRERFDKEASLLDKFVDMFSTRRLAL